MKKEQNRYSQLIEHIFLEGYKTGDQELEFERDEIVTHAKKMKIDLPKNLGDLIYSFRYRAALPEALQNKAPEGKEWIIRPAGRSKYKFVLVNKYAIVPNKLLAETKILDSTPGMVSKYAMNDEQGLLAKVRYNRLIDIFTGITCYSLQNHLRTTVPEIGQIETDELYVGVDSKGAHYIFPVQAKGGTDRISIVQIEQDYALCKYRFNKLNCKPIATQFMDDDLIVLFEFEPSEDGLKISTERHYRLVTKDQLNEEELASYSNRTS
jgi:hypothetical protein